MNEIWKKVTVNSDYEVSNMGNIRSHKHGKTRMLKPFRRGGLKKDEQNRGVYLSVRLLDNGIVFTTKKEALSAIEDFDG